MPLPVGPVLARSLYLYENKGLQAIEVLKRDLYAYENKGLQAITVSHRGLYVYENRGIQHLEPEARDLYLYEAKVDGEVFPWLERIEPQEQYRGGEVNLFGDGFGGIIEAGVEPATTVTVSSTNGANVGDNVKDRVETTAWASNGDGAASWLRMTFGGGPEVITAVSLVDRSASGITWGVPVFRFSDGGPDIDGAVAVPAKGNILGGTRQLYELPAPRTSTYLEVRVKAGTGVGANRGLAEVWVWVNRGVGAEDSDVLLGDDPDLMGTTGAWLNRSPGLWPANSGVRSTPAATVIVPVDGDSGLVRVRESI